MPEVRANRHRAEARPLTSPGRAGKPGYRYVTQGKVIRNSAGQVIGRDEQEGGVIEITRVELLMSVGKIVQRVADPNVGDRIETSE